MLQNEIMEGRSKPNTDKKTAQIGVAPFSPRIIATADISYWKSAWKIHD